jgi:hypothetical protein
MARPLPPRVAAAQSSLEVHSGGKSLEKAIMQPLETGIRTMPKYDVHSKKCVNGGPGRTRTYNQQIMSLLL